MPRLCGYPLLDDIGSLKLRLRAPAVVAASPADVASTLWDLLACDGVTKTHERGASATSTGRGQPKPPARPPKRQGRSVWVVCAIPVLAAWAQRRERLVPAAPCGDPLGNDPRPVRRVDWFGGRRESTRGGSRYRHRPPPRPQLLLPAVLRPGLTGPTGADATRDGARACVAPAQD